MDAKEIREKYLSYMKKRGHAIVPSCGLVPDNDPTTLFTSAGMQAMIPYLSGQKHPLGSRIANSQKCLRTQDIEEAGDNRHTTFFEMLGNWSLNDYFKKEQLSWMFEFLAKEVGLDPKNIYVTAFRGLPEAGIPKDEETANIWKELFVAAGVDAAAVDFAEIGGMQNGRIFYYDEKKNWWSRSGTPDKMPEGELGGPDSEIFYDFGADLKLHENSPWKDLPCHPNCDCGRFLEIGNNVFMEYVKRNGAVVKMENRNVDFGGGLERIAAASINDSDVFKIDLFWPAIEKLQELSGKKYKDGTKTTAAMRVIADHIRAAVFLIGDGVFPSNKAQGYFARRLVRRAIVKGHELGIENNFLNEIASIYSNIYLNIYKLPAEQIKSELEKEETKFRKTLKQGLKEMERRIAENASDGKQLFNLYQSYGFPLELSLEIAEEKNVSIAKSAIDDFNAELKKHQELSRTASAGMFKGGLADAGEQTTKLHTAAHLLLAALRRVLGDHVVQRGSNITAERLRFDFSHPRKMTLEQIKQVEDSVNEQIQKNIPVVRKEMPLSEAQQSGAMGVFGSKYG
ncbi:MAG TPA: alanine--tRNA ligase, partial [Candidatus Pacearchaeota archaeon]|nr:alanine--tRNA ligase [Candidatus Pacearchaeota archaeon]